MKNKEKDIEVLRRYKNLLIKKVDILNKKYKKLYSKIDISKPMSKEEKQLKNEISKIYSDINQIVIKIRNYKK